MFPGSYVPRVLSPGSYVPRVLCSQGPMFPGSYVPRVLCSQGPIFPVFCVPQLYIAQGWTEHRGTILGGPTDLWAEKVSYFILSRIRDNY